MALADFLPHPGHGLCRGCGLSSATALCEVCRHQLKAIVQPCQQCALPVYDNPICGQCLKRPPHYHATWVTWQYQWPLDQFILAFKYGNQPDWAEALAELMVANTPPDLDHKLLVPIPITRQRYIERGFNQASLLASCLERRCGGRLHTTALQRSGEAAHQSALKRQQRRANVKGTFALGPGSVRQRRVVLVDDVITTAETVREAAKVLMTQAQALSVEVWALARSLPTR